MLILAIGLYLLSGSITSIASYLWVLREWAILDSSTKGYHFSGLLGYGLIPLFLSSALLLFSGQIERFFLGGKADVTLETSALKEETVIIIGIRAMGVYFFCTYGSAMVATFFELIAIRAGNRQFEEAKVLADTIANGSGLAFSAILCFRTAYVARLVFEQKK